MAFVRSIRFLLLLSEVACALVLSSGAQENRSVEEHFFQAQQDQQQGLLDAAAREYQAVLKLQPELPEAYVNLGLVYYAQAKFEDSAHALSSAAKLRPSMRGVSLWLGIDNVKLNRPVQGAALLREAIRQDPSNKLAQMWLGTALWDSGQMDSALLQLRKANKRSPGDPDLIFALSEAYDKAATQQTERVLEESSGTSLSDLVYGSIYAEQREWTKAESHLGRAIERDPHSVDARLKLTQVYVAQANVAAAKERVDQATELAPHSAAALALSGELLLLMQQPAEGLDRIEKAVGIDYSEATDVLGLTPDDQPRSNQVDAKLLLLCREAIARLQARPNTINSGVIALAALHTLAGDEGSAVNLKAGPAQSHRNPSADDFAQATAALHEHRYDDAEAALQRWLAAHPNDHTAQYELASARSRISRSQLRRLLAVAPDSYHVHQMLGRLYMSREEDEKALAEYVAVAAARPDLPGVHFWLGHLYWKHGDADHALAELTRELELSPGHPEANGELGAVLVAQNRDAEAIPHLESALRSKPDLWPAYAQLGRAYASEKEYARAEEVLTRALAHDENGSAHYQLARVFRAEGKAAQAVQAFAKVRAIRDEKTATPSTEDAGSAGEKP